MTKFGSKPLNIQWKVMKITKKGVGIYFFWWSIHGWKKPSCGYWVLTVPENSQLLTEILSLLRSCKNFCCIQMKWKQLKFSVAIYCMWFCRIFYWLSYYSNRNFVLLQLYSINSLFNPNRQKYFSLFWLYSKAERCPVIEYC